MKTTMRSAWRRGDPLEALLSREWMVANGLGGYAAGTLAGVCTRRFHGMVIAAFPSPGGRVIYASHLEETATLPSGAARRMSGDQIAREPLALPDEEFLTEVRFEDGLPVWRFEAEGAVLEKRVVVVHRQNSAIVTYDLLRAPRPVTLAVRPAFEIRPHEGVLARSTNEEYTLVVDGDRYEISLAGYAPLRMHVVAPSKQLLVDRGRSRERFYAVESARGYDCHGPLFSRGEFRIVLAEGESAAFRLSTEPWEQLAGSQPHEVAAAEAQRRERLVAQAHPAVERDPTGVLAELVLAADQFIIRPQSRVADTLAAQASGDEARTVIAGYPWFTDWGRDTMISLEGLTLLTGRNAEAGYILRTFAHHVKDGLIPNLFPEGESKGLYHTADATLWFFHAIERYVRASGDTHILDHLLPTLVDIVDHHERGTRFGIRVDPKDGLLTQGADGYQLTWMDAKVGDWVVTPRRGKAVEINALFYNALRLVEGWVRAAWGEERAAKYTALADRVKKSFNARFWFAEGKYLYDVVDGENGDDTSLRPNQVLAIALAHPVLDPAHWSDVLSIVRERLWTPVGLRSLAPGQPGYKPVYDGDLRSRDAAYHQGTVWAWLIGPFVDAWRRAHPEDRATLSSFVKGFAPHLGEACVGSISEIFDAEAPFRPRGCYAQAWSVAEVLRAMIAIEEGA